MVSRFDQLLGAIGNGANAFSTTIQSGNANAQANRGPRPAAQVRQSDGTLARLQTGLQSLSVGASEIVQAHQAPADSMLSTPRPSTRDPRTIAGSGVNRPAEAAPEDGDELPGYSRRAPTRTGKAAGGPSSLPLKAHDYVSRSGKLELTLISTGTGTHPLYLSGQGDDQVQGSITLRLEKDEPFSAIRVRVKCVARTVTFRHHSGGRHAQADEMLLLELSKTLWEAPAGVGGEAYRLPAGTHTWAFDMQLPDALSFAANDGARLPLPPSFALMSTEGSIGRNLEVASIKYYVKCTAARPGMFRANERLFAPFLYQLRQQRPEMSPLREVALAEGLPPPGPSEDPAGWFGKKMKNDVRRGLITSKRAFYEAVVLLPSPPVFDRHTPLQFVVKLRSSDPAVTTNFPPSAVQAFLLQRVHVSSQGQPGMHEQFLARATFAPDGAPNGEMLTTPDPDGGRWTKRVRGEIVLPAYTPSFRTPTLAASFALAVHVECPGPGNDINLAVPVTLVSAAAPVRINLPIEEHAAPPSIEPMPDLPPSYYEVLEESSSRK